MEVDSLATMNIPNVTYTQPIAAPAEQKAPTQQQPQPQPKSAAASNKPELFAYSDTEVAAIERAIEIANGKLAFVGREFNYSIHEKTRQVMIKVLNSESKEVIREIPPEKSLDAIVKMLELAGILFDEKR